MNVMTTVAAPPRRQTGFTTDEFARMVACGAFDDAGWIPADKLALVVEVSGSTRDRDLGLKRRLYAAAGIPTYWVVDAERAIVHIFDRPENDDYAGLALARFGEPMAVPGTDGTIALE